MLLHLYRFSLNLIKILINSNIKHEHTFVNICDYLQTIINLIFSPSVPNYLSILYKKINIKLIIA
jgi:hypothetical protein